MAPIDNFLENGQIHNTKDPRWLQVEICREFQRGKCSRGEMECRYAHPDENVQIENGGRVTACYDSMKGRCQRESCKYFHPPHHIKLQLEANGRLLKQHKQQLQAMASQNMIQTPTVLPLNTIQHSGVSAFPLTFVSSAVLTPSPHNTPVVATSIQREELKSSSLSICHDYLNETCSVHETQCFAAHPPMELLRDRNQKRITVCMDFVKGRCTRETCRYFHPPEHLKQKLKTVRISQSQLNVISSNSRKRSGESKDDLEDQAKQQAFNYTLINTPLALPATNFATIFQPSTFQAAFNGMQFAPAFFSTLPLTVPQLTTTTVNTTPYVHPQITPLASLNNNKKQNQRPICRDYKAGNCRRDSCRFIHLDDRNVEVIDGHVTICVDSTKGSCHRNICKYYHIPNSDGNANKDIDVKSTLKFKLPLV
ncbi:muscleblind-like protein 3 [Xenia sp. Carnegie-2017]|uniref:muscleblind-like protein 3 n=1 Tax=Xenia sp. Carnegie-2017 TaxID=2897299 RepID=UPI001F0455CE|nr:muscleblind-like protein 3 [Xenia sp. Carnegie-2017]